MGDVKNFLYAWCGKRKVTPAYEIRAVGNKNRQKFMCEARVAGFNYIGMGNSTNKKDAQTNAARDFLNYLVRVNEIKSEEIPAFGVAPASTPAESMTGTEAVTDGYEDPMGAPVPPHLAIISETESASSTGMGSSGYGGAGWDRGANLKDYYSRREEEEEEAQATLESEEVDLNAGLHGNWTLENAKARLNQYFQKEKIQGEYKYTQVGPDHNRSFIAEMTIYVKQLARRIFAREHGSNKKLAAQSCALSLVRQLYHLNIIEAYSGQTKKKEGESVEPYDVNINSYLEAKLQKIVEEMQLETVPPPYDPSDPVALNIGKLAHFEPSQKQNPTGVVPWSPPQSNWNPWTSCNIDEGPLAHATPEQISMDIKGNLLYQLENDQNLQKIIQERSSLPVKNFEGEILEAIHHYPVVIIRGATGCGKTTQVPQYILDECIHSGRAAECSIVVTQPRRISAVSVAERVAYERGEEPGNSCGYSVRFESVLPRPHASVMFCTVGVLLRKLEAGIRGISHVIVDEIHERDINTDFLLVVLRDVVQTYPEIRVILMSATIDTSMFCEYFFNCPIIEVFGRTYPVQEYFLEDCIQMTKFIPPPREKKKKDKDEEGVEDDDTNCNLICSDEYGPETKRNMAQLNEKETPFELIEVLLKYIETLNVPGAVLIFLPGWNLIYTMQKYLEMNPHFGSLRYRILPLHSQIPREEQRKVFDPAPPGITKVILSTNIAETSITINDVIYVIDSCKQKVKLFTAHNNMTNYATVWASKTNLEQRKGRAGRVRAGFCFHLCSRARFVRLETHMTPEIFRTPLHEIALSIKLLRLGAIGQFLAKAIEPPPLDAVIEAEHTLRELDALDCNDELTPLGRILARLPIEPRLGKMMIMGCIFYVGDAVCTISAATCFPEPFISEGKRLGYVHRNFAGNRFSDHVALLSVFQTWDHIRIGGEDAETRFCDNKRLNMATLRMTWEAKVQLKDILINSGFPEDCLMTQEFSNIGPDNNLDVVISLLAFGLYPNVCYHKDKRKILTTEGRNALIHKSSVNCPFSSQDMKYPSPFFVFGEKIRTRAISAKAMTLVSPLQLLLFGSKKVVSDGEIIILDDWLKLRMSHNAAACITAMRAAIEALVVEVTKNPEIISDLDPMNKEMLSIIGEISKPLAAGINLVAGKMRYGDGPRPPKMARYDNGGGYRGRGRGGGGGGGGKIRTRRYHLAAASQKPYPKNKQGIINIVKESVKSIVPTWLQRYFRQSEEASPGEERRLEENINYHPAFEDDTADNSIEIDGRITPEPTRVTLEEPSTSRSGLNFTDILTRPSLHRGHLNCSILDSPPPFCQPSTSSAFPISNTGLSLGKEIKDSTSQHDDDNISTTSGFSSRASDKDIQVSKNISAPPLWSTETERPITISQHSASSSKKPGFNLSAFGALSPSLGNSSVLKTSQLGNSPFYPGKTTYGGAAAAARQSRLAVTPYQTPIRRQMKAKQVNAQSYGVTSSTARRILQSLEKMSSPLADAKRIPPSVSSSLSPPVERSMLNITDFHSPSKRAKSHYPPIQKLVTPKTVSLSVNRSQYFKPSLTSTTDSGRTRQRIEMDHKGMHEKNVTVEQQSKPRERGVSSETSLKFSTSASNGLPPAAGTGGGKMRRERGVHYVSKPAQDEMMEIPPLPEISLPISTSSLPNFSFGPLASTTVKSSPVSAAQSIVNKVQPAGNAGSPVFRFSSPIVKSTEAEVLPPVSVGGFKFSVPVAKSSDHSEPKETPGLPLTNATVNSISKKREMECDGPLKPAKVLKEGSVLDILKSPGFSSPTTSSTYSAAATPPVATSTVVYTRPAINSFSGGSVSGLGDLSKKQVSSSWQCDTCLIQNKLADNKCIACQAAKVPASDDTKEAGTLTQNIAVKSAVSTTGTQSFAEKFKAAAGTWDCDTCLVQNKRESTKCVACETPKPGTGVKQALVLPFVTDSATPVSSSSSFSDGSVTLGFGDKFKKPKDAWECSVCLVSNKAEDSKCVACQSDKAGGSVPVVSSSASSLPALSGGFLSLDKFKKPEGSWDCETCLVQNKADAAKCIACESPKPGSKPEPKGFGTATTSAPSFSASSTPSFKFGIQSSSSETTQTLGGTGKNFKFGEQGGFKFGITSELASSASTVTGGFKFSKTEGSKPGSFPSESKSEDSKGGKNNSTFSFGLPSGTSSASTASFQFGIANPGQQEKKEGLNQPAVGGFTFGSGSSASAAVAEQKTEISGFKFGKAEEKEASVTAFLLKKPEEKKDEIPLIKGGFTFGNGESATPPTVVLGRTDEKQESVSNPLIFGKKTENEGSKAQSIFSFGKAEQAKEEGPLKPAFSFSLAKPAEKEMEQPAKPAFTFGAKGSTADQGSAKPTFSFLSSTSSNTVIPSVSLGGSGGSSTGGSSSNNCIFSNTTSSLNPPPLFLFGQASNTVSSSAFGNPSESSTSQPFGFSQDTKPPAATTTSTGTPVQFLFGTVATTNTTANTGFSFAAPATTAPPTGSSSSSFVFGSGFSAPAAGPAFGAGQTPTFGQSQGSSQPPAPSFGSLSTASLFPVGSQPAPPAFGSVSSSTQPPVFGQQTAQQPGFGSSTSSSTGPVFGSSTANFNFTGNSPGVFTFGATPSASAAQPAGSSGFPFTQPSPSFNLGSNGKNIFSASGSSVSGRKIKTAVRRRK